MRNLFTMPPKAQAGKQRVTGSQVPSHRRASGVRRNRGGARWNPFPRNVQNLPPAIKAKRSPKKVTFAPPPAGDEIPVPDLVLNLPPLPLAEDTELDPVAAEKRVIKQKLKLRLPEGVGLQQLKAVWTWMHAEYNPDMFSESSVQFGLDAPVDVSLPLEANIARTEQSYARCELPLRSLAETIYWIDGHFSSQEWIEANPFIHLGATLLGTFRAWVRRSSTRGLTGSAKVLRAAKHNVHRRMLRQVVSESVATLSSIATPTAGDRYWVTGEKDTKEGIKRTRYSVVGETRASWFANRIIYPKGISNIAELGPHDGYIYHCVELTAYLKRFAEFRERSVVNTRTIQARAVMWCKEHGVQDVDAVVFRAPSVVKALLMESGELAAHDIANSASFRNAVDVSSQLRDGTFAAAHDSSVRALIGGTGSARAYLGNRQVYRPAVKWFGAGCRFMPGPLGEYGVPYLGISPWFKLRQLSTPIVDIPFR